MNQLWNPDKWTKRAISAGNRKYKEYTDVRDKQLETVTLERLENQATEELDRQRLREMINRL